MFWYRALDHDLVLHHKYDCDVLLNVWQVVQVYIQLMNESKQIVMKKQLVTFERVQVPPSSTVTVQLIIESFATAIWQQNSDGKLQVWANFVLFYELTRQMVLSATWPSGTARRWQILRGGFDSRLEPIAFDNGRLLTRRAQTHFAVSLNYCSIFSSI